MAGATPGLWGGRSGEGGGGGGGGGRGRGGGWRGGMAVGASGAASKGTAYSPPQELGQGGGGAERERFTIRRQFEQQHIRSTAISLLKVGRGGTPAEPRPSRQSCGWPITGPQGRASTCPIQSRLCAGKYTSSAFAWQPLGFQLRMVQSNSRDSAIASRSLRTPPFPGHRHSTGGYAAMTICNSALQC